MKKKSSYREMLRNRVPMSADMALKWCKAKDKWIEHTYKAFIHVFADKSERYKVTCILLGIKGRGRKFVFDRTIDWEGLNKEEYNLWKRVSSWQAWLSKNLIDIEDDYKHAIRMGRLDSFPVEFIKKYMKASMPKPGDKNYQQKLQRIDIFTTFVTNYLGNIHKDYV